MTGKNDLPDLDQGSGANPPNTIPLPGRVHRTKAAARTVYDRLSGWYDWLAASEAPFGAAGVRLLGPRPGERVLEIGPGTGRNALALAEQVGPGGRVVGVDLSAGMAKVARQKARRASFDRQVALIQGDGARLPLPAGCFDGAFAAFTLELFDTPEIPLVLRELHRALRSGGRLCIVALAAVERPAWPVRLYEWFHRRFPAWVDCRPIPAAALLRQAGFAIREQRRERMWGLPVDLLLAIKEPKV